MIQVTCPGCGSKLNAKDELNGQMRACPKCKTPMLISASASAKTAVAPPEPEAKPEPPPEARPPVVQASAVQTPAVQTPSAQAAAGQAPTVDVPVQTDVVKRVEAIERLNRNNHYLILNKTSVVATWENNGHGWMLKTNFGLVSAARNHEQLPGQGNFQMVELIVDFTDDGRRLEGLRTFQLAQRYALTELDKGDDKICKRISGPFGLNKDQKLQIRKIIREQFMHQVWEHADNVFEFLDNLDFHSPGVGYEKAAPPADA